MSALEIKADIGLSVSGRFPPIPVANEETQRLAAVSALYLLMAVAAIGVTGYEQVMSVIVLTIAISVYAHGMSAVPLSRRYGHQSTSTE